MSAAEEPTGAVTAPIDYTIDPARRLVLITLGPVYRVPDIRALGDALRADPAFSPEFSMLTDARATETIEASSADLQSLAVTSPFGPGSKQAIVATRDVLFGMGRVYGVHAESMQRTAQVFRSRAEAVAWLGVGPAPEEIEGEGGSR